MIDYFDVYQGTPFLGYSSKISMKYIINLDKLSMIDYSFFFSRFLERLSEFDPNSFYVNLKINIFILFFINEHCTTKK